DRPPGWLVQFPWLVDPGALHELRAVVSGTTAEGMLRVFAQVVEELTSDMTLVLVLEDLHWAYASTVDLVSVLAERPEPARFLLLGTYRPAEAIAHGGPFDTMRRALALKRRSVELALRLLPLSGVETYLSARFAGGSPPPALARLLHAHTEGNPLFLVTAVDFLVARGWLAHGDGGVTVRAELETIERHIPGSLQELVELQILGLDELEIAVLEAASVAGCGFGARAAEVAAELAAHFERGHEPARAITWLACAAESAERRFAPREAAGYLRRALALLESGGEGAQHWRRELGLRLSLGAAVI